MLYFFKLVNTKLKGVSMKTTKHSLARMSQRGLPKKLIDLAFEFGKEQGDKLILNRKTTQKLINEIDRMRQELLKVMDKGGVTVVVDSDTLITAYNTNSYKRN
jgi:Skp family chaperone for outer membrane proteins